MYSALKAREHMMLQIDIEVLCHDITDILLKVALNTISLY
jgi:hypothetical protein